MERGSGLSGLGVSSGGRSQGKGVGAGRLWKESHREEGSRPTPGTPPPPGLPFPNGECRAVGAHGTARLPGNLSNPSASVQSAPDAVRPQCGPRLPRAPPPRSVDGVCVCDCVHECTSVCDCVYDCVYVVDRGVECHEERDLCTPIVKAWPCFGWLQPCTSPNASSWMCPDGSSPLCLFMV